MRDRTEVDLIRIQRTPAVRKVEALARRHGIDCLNRQIAFGVIRAE
jgi:hypothetical protein